MSPNPDGTIKVVNTLEFLANGTSQSIQGSAKFFNASKQPPEASLSVTFGPFSASYPNYIVLNTDYGNFSIVYSCESAFSNTASATSIFILARRPAVDVSVIYQILTQILRFKINVNTLRFTVQNPGL